MAKQLNVKLNFDADTTRAKQQIQDLQNSLNNVINAPTNKLGAGISTNIQAAIKDVANLQYELNKATNADTGKIDFTKLNHSITKSGKSLRQYGQQLMSLGPMGQQAFGQLAQAIASSEIPVFRVSNKLKELGTTLANTARWQLSSSVLHGFMGAIQSAYGYAQDLNESLNNIRIVTGQSVDDMAKFAKEANKAAKALSATTTEYTNASLIYYQQGLSDQQVKERTDVTIKMANVARESAETVSDQMTAVWNNFYDGSKTLEYYADVMTALGAATASSTAEISEGLNKFAAVAETVGLSYEYATAALATVTATTRQSADVVGTAFKTLFARIQDLELGNTLDDGTTLGSYSQALEKVGINIIDTSGNLKQMDVILEEMAARWDTLGKAEQTALAQNVAGVRQYTQLVALMENWDFMKENLSTASNATGTLQAQADIYAESWEAAQDRVRAAAEKIYSSLIDEDFFIDLTNGFEDILSILGKFIDSIGGVKGVLSSVGVLLTSIFSDKIAQGITNMSLAMRSMTPGGRAKIADQRTVAMAGLKADFARHQSNADSVAGQVERGNVSNTLDISNLMLQNEQKMSELEKDQNRRLIERLQLLQQEHLERAKSLDILRQELEYTQKRLALKAKAKGQSENYANFVGASTAIDTIAKNTADLDFNDKNLDIGSTANAIKAELAPVLNEYKGLDVDLKLLDDVQEAKDLSAALDLILKKLYDTKEAAEGVLTDNGFTTKELDHIPKTLENIDVAERKVNASGKEVKKTFETLSKDIPNAKGAQKDWSTALVAGAQAAMSAAMMINSLRGAINTLKDPDISGWEKFTSVLMSLGMTIPGLVSIWKSLKTVINAETIAKVLNTAVTMKSVKANLANANAKRREAQAAIKNRLETAKETIVKGIKNPKQLFGNIKQGFGNLGQSWNNFSFNSLDAKQKKPFIEQALKNQGYTRVKGGWQASGSDKILKSNQIMKTDANVVKNASALAGKQSLAGLAKMVGSFAAVAAAVAVLAVGISLAVKHYNRFETAAANAEKAATQAAQEHQKMTDAYSNFKSNASAYEEGAEGLKKLAKGSVEYKEALLEANNAAMQLIKSNKNLQYHVEEGRIVLDNLEEVQQQELDALGRSSAMVSLTDNIAKEKRQEANEVALARKLNSASDVGGEIENAAAMTGIGAVAGGLLALVTVLTGPVGWAIAGAATLGAAAIGGGIASGIAGRASGSERQALDDIAEYVRKNDNSIFASDKEFENYLRNGLELKDETLIKSLVENRDAVKQLTEAENARLAQERANKKVAYSQYNMGNDKYANAKVNGSSISAFLDSAYVAYSENQANIDKTEAWISDLFKGKNEDFWKEWLVYTKGESADNVQMGKNEVTGDNYRVTGLNGAHASIWQKDEQGVWQRLGEKNDYSEAQAREELREAKLMADASDLIGMSIADYQRGNRLMNAKGDVNQDIVTSILSAYKEGVSSTDLSGFKYSDLLKIKDLETGNNFLDQIIKNSYENSLGDKERLLASIKGLREKLTDQGLLDLYFSLDYDENATEAVILEAVQRAQAIADANAVLLSFNANDELKELINKQNKTAEDWARIKELYEDSNISQLGVDWETFSTASVREQNALIDRANKLNTAGSMGTAYSAETMAQENFEATEEKDKEFAKNAKDYSAQFHSAKAIIDSNHPAFTFLDNLYGKETVSGLINNMTPEQFNDFITRQFSNKTLSYENFMADFVGALGLGDEGYKGIGSLFAAWGMNNINENLNTNLFNNTGSTTFERWQNFFAGYQTGNFLDLAGDYAAHGNISPEALRNAQWDMKDLVEGGIIGTYIDENGDAIIPSTMADYEDAVKTRQELELQYLANLEDAGVELNTFYTLVDKLAKEGKNTGFAWDIAHNLLLMREGYEALIEKEEEWAQKLKSGDLLLVAEVLNEEIYPALSKIFNIDTSVFAKYLTPEWFASEEGKSAFRHLTDENAENDYVGQALIAKQIYGTAKEQDAQDFISLLESDTAVLDGKLTEDGKAALEGLIAAGQKEMARHLASLAGIVFEADATGKIINHYSSADTLANFDFSSLMKDYQNERYKKEDYQIARAEENIDKAYGNALVGAYNTAYNRYKSKNETAQKWYKTDSEALTELLGEDNLKGLLNPDGTVNLNNLMANYDSIYNNLDNAQKESFDKAVDQLLETNEVIIETSEQMKDAWFNKFMKGLDNQIEASDNRLSEIENTLKIYGDDIENAAERLELMFNPNPGKLSQWDIYNTQAENYSNALKDLDTQRKNNEITDAQYAEGLQKIKDGTASLTNSLVDLNNQMQTYYEDTLSKAKEELSDYTDHMEHVTEVTEHYKNVLGLIGKYGMDQDVSGYTEAMRTLNEYNRDSIENRKIVAENYYKTLAQQVADWNAKLDQKGLSEETRKFYEEQRDAAIDAADEAQKELFSLTESWLEAEKALIEFELEELANELEKQLTGSFGTFEDLLDQFDKLNARQEEYLTETNKMYETNKMMAEANKLLDETTNKAAKQKISNFVNETKKLQENTQLSEFELELQQAKYDLLLAEIALEEARGAKSTVRLTRDNEGNFGYVYTADQEAIFDAEQKVADAENKLYNKSLDGQQKYQEQYFKATEEMFNELTELETAYLNGEIESKEAYERKKQEITEHYYGENGILRTYSNLYNIAVQANADATADNWFNNYDRMGKDADAFGLDLDTLKDKTNKYLEDVQKKTTNYKEIAAKAYQEVKDAVNSVVEGDEKDGGLTKLMQESDTLLHQITDENGLLDALKNETTEVGNLATAYGNVITNVQGLINAAKGINSDVIGRLNALLDPEGNPETGGTNPPPNTNPGTGEGEGGRESDENGSYTGSYKPIGKTHIVEDGDTLWDIGVNNGIIPGSKEWYDWIEYNKHMGSFDDPNVIYAGHPIRLNTGGYTGAWGSEGRWALLDEKELVLNSTDTENILRTVSFVRELASLIDSQASMSNISGFFSSPGIGNHNSTLEQNVEIHAEFPNATDRYEIEEAFNSLVNRASQYANRK